MDSVLTEWGVSKLGLPPIVLLKPTIVSAKPLAIAEIGFPTSVRMCLLLLLEMFSSFFLFVYIF